MLSELSAINGLLEIYLYELQVRVNPGSSLSGPSILHRSSERHSLTSCSLQSILYCGTSLSKFTFSLKGCSKTLNLHIILDTCTWKVIICQYKEVCQHHLLFIRMCVLANKCRQSQCYKVSHMHTICTRVGAYEKYCCTHFIHFTQYIPFLCPWKASSVNNSFSCLSCD